MSKPIPGRNYTVQNEGTLSKIAASAYGDPSLWTIIFEANLKTLKSQNEDLIFPGEVLFIPERVEVRDAKAQALKPSINRKGFVVEINNREIPLISGKITRTMDTAADAWTGVIDWMPGLDEFIDKATAPYSYAPSKAFIDNQELVTGPLYTVNQILDGQGSRKDLHGFAATVAMVDSDLNPDISNQRNVSLLDRCQLLAKPYGLKVFTDNGTKAAADEIFKRVKAKKNENIFSHLRGLAKQRQLLISSTTKGNLLLTRANVTSPPVGIIEESAGQASLSYQAKFDGRKRFSNYRVTSQTPRKRNKKVGISRDPNVPIMRFKNITVDNATDGNIQKTADWARSKQFAEALVIPFPVPTWFAPNGTLWRENTTVVVQSKTLGVPDGFKFLIRQVDYSFSADGETATLFLVPPQTYTGELIIEPWRE